MEVKHDLETRYFNLYDDNGTHMGEIEYKKGGNNEIYATHTEVFSEFEGKGYAAVLLDAMVKYAEENSLKIVPICPYVIRAFNKYPDKYASVIKK